MYDACLKYMLQCGSEGMVNMQCATVKYLRHPVSDFLMQESKVRSALWVQLPLHVLLLSLCGCCRSGCLLLVCQIRTSLLKPWSVLRDVLADQPPSGLGLYQRHGLRCCCRKRCRRRCTQRNVVLESCR